MGLEGIVAKRVDRPCRSGRSPDWVRIKNPDAPTASRVIEHELMIGGAADVLCGAVVRLGDSAQEPSQRGRNNISDDTSGASRYLAQRCGVAVNDLKAFRAEFSASLPPDADRCSAAGIAYRLAMSKAPTPESIAASLCVPERVLLFCVASHRTGARFAAHAFARHLVLRNLLEREHAGELSPHRPGTRCPLRIARRGRAVQIGLNTGTGLPLRAASGPALSLRPMP